MSNKQLFWSLVGTAGAGGALAAAIIFDSTIQFLLIALGLMFAAFALRGYRQAGSAAHRQRGANKRQRTSPKPNSSASVKLPKVLTPEPIADDTTLDTTQWSLELLQALEWKRFEQLCAAYFQTKGYRADLSQIGADGGIDIHLYRPSKPDEALAIIQCKAWTSYRVGVKPLRELYGVQAATRAPLSIFMTSSSFTPDAKQFSQDKRLQLIDGASLLGLLQALLPSQQEKLLRLATEGDFSTPTCPKCDTKMVKRHGQQGANPNQAFWGCRSFPHCRHTMMLAKHER